MISVPVEGHEQTARAVPMQQGAQARGAGDSHNCFRIDLADKAVTEQWVRRQGGFRLGRVGPVADDDDRHPPHAESMQDVLGKPVDRRWPRREKAAGRRISAARQDVAGEQAKDRFVPIAQPLPHTTSRSSFQNMILSLYRPWIAR